MNINFYHNGVLYFGIETTSIFYYAFNYFLNTTLKESLSESLSFFSAALIILSTDSLGLSFFIIHSLTFLIKDYPHLVQTFRKYTKISYISIPSILYIEKERNYGIVSLGYCNKKQEGGEGMSFINPIGKNKNNNLKNQPVNKVERNIIRKERSDKKHTIKFPVEHILSMKLKTYCKLMNQNRKTLCIPPLTQTEFNTKLLEFGLARLELVDFTLPYQDTKVYMQSKLFETDYQGKLAGPYGIAVRQNLSERRIVYCIVHSIVQWLERGGHIEEVIQ